MASMQTSPGGETSARLLAAYVAGTITEAELQQLSELLAQQEAADDELADILYQMGEDTPPLAHYDRASVDEMIRSILEQARPQTLVRSIHWRRWLVAASILILVSVGGYWWWQSTMPAPVPTVAATHDVKAPAKNTARIQLTDGRMVSLDSAGNGALAHQSGATLVKLADGQIVYRSAAGENKEAMAYNTLYNPRGSKVIDMVLADGSRVWLNAGSSITYPVVFTSTGERRVTMDGEAYFEVTHDAARPFIVAKDNMQVKVLGTHFNVNAYADEPNIKVTLLEGSVNVNISDARSVTLHPGQQAVCTNAITLNTTPDLEQVLAWKNGTFSFNKTGIGSIMRQIARWYDVEVQFEGTVPQGTYSGDVSRDANISTVMKILKISGVDYTIQGRKITVKGHTP